VSMNDGLSISGGNLAYDAKYDVLTVRLSDNVGLFGIDVDPACVIFVNGGRIVTAAIYGYKDMLAHDKQRLKHYETLLGIQLLPANGII
jgi:hypothetical protein